MLDKARNHAVRCMEDSFAYAKDKWYKSHATQGFKVGELVLLATTNFNNIKGFKKLKDPFAGTFVNNALHGKNAAEVELSEELNNKHPKFAESLINPYKSSDSGKFPLRNKVTQFIPPVQPSGTKKITKVLKERNLRTKKVRECLVRYSDPACEAQFLAERTYLNLQNFSEGSENLEITILKSNILFSGGGNVILRGIFIYTKTTTNNKTMIQS
ncbi:hypothetical protein O181_020433 [Austropuccinia psidii MF-1]|uniref:Uncharacterized protein n=1 Tax=Austropuccinia psidii MF-1 TaxID=1389203 RepID=A0A9Q3CCW8_9BASI|nr:hypothetical protein [Austropuccinia psidii MF-1]